jgi:fumarate reductase subunit D
MADPHHAPADHDAAAYQRGSMEIEEQKATWALFGALSKWGSLAIACLVLLLTVWFMPNGGFVPAAISAIVVAVVGWWFLRAKPAAH